MDIYILKEIIRIEPLGEMITLPKTEYVKLDKIEAKRFMNFIENKNIILEKFHQDGSKIYVDEFSMVF